MYNPLISSSFDILITICIVYGSGSIYDDKKLYEYSKKVLGLDQVICPVVEIYKNTPKKARSGLLLSIGIMTDYFYCQRRISIEPI